MDAKTFLNKLDSIPDIPTLPTIIIKMNEMIQDQDISIKQLSATIEKEQALVTKILRLVNSTFYGSRSKTNNIPHAVIMLGFNTIRNAVISVSTTEAFSGEKRLEGFEISGFWKHSIAVAVTSGYLSQQSRLDVPDNCFVAGLLHDIGKVILSQHFSELFRQVWRSIAEDGLSFYEAEEKLLPVNHAQVGGYLAKKWLLPPSLTDSITYHHAIRKSVPNLDQLLIVHTADSIVNTYKPDTDTFPGFSSLNPEAKEALSRHPKSVPDWFPKIAPEIDSACEFFLNEE